MIGSAWAAGPGGTGGSIFSDPTFWVAVSFVIFFAIAGKAAWKGITGMLDQRAMAITKQLDDALKLRAEAEATLAEYKIKRDAAESEAKGIIDLATAEAASLKARAETELANTIKLRERQALDRIAQAEAKAMAEVRATAVDAAISATRTLLEDRMKAGQGTELVDQAIADLPRRLN
jgi:F-type H+-transporting ATPase subunit b